MQERLISKYSGAVPRYTSYPTAPHFHDGIAGDTYADWLQALAPGQTLSLYIHIPYCDRLCWFCACHTRHTLKYEPITRYLEALYQEIAEVGARVSPQTRVTSLHLGGGSPTMLSPADMVTLVDRLRRAFTFAPDCEISVEMDPNDLDEGRYDALADIGLTRASLGVQDFDPKVQAVINRLQSFEQTAGVVEAVRARGVHSVNCDILYGLPHQTGESLTRTVEDILSLDPDRIALFGYAHVPWMKKHQQLIPETALPDARARLEQAAIASDRLLAAGYEAIGIDHFAKPHDSLARAQRSGTLRRNFQGYTDDGADALIGLGASSIGQLPQGYVQNMPATGEYERLATGSGIAVVRGIALDGEDRARAHVIERIMCEFGFDFADLARRHPDFAAMLIGEARMFAASDTDGISEISNERFSVTPRGKPFTRSVAAAFDAYLGNGRGRHSIAV